MRHVSTVLTILGLVLINVALPGAIHTFTAADAPADGLKGALFTGVMGAITAGVGLTTRTFSERRSHHT